MPPSSPNPRELLRRWIEHMGSKAASARLLECHPSYLVHLLADPGRKVGLDFAFALQTATEDWEEGPIRAEWWRAEVPASTGTDD